VLSKLEGFSQELAAKVAFVSSFTANADDCSVIGSTKSIVYDEVLAVS